MVYDKVAWHTNVPYGNAMSAVRHLMFFMDWAIKNKIIKSEFSDLLQEIDKEFVLKSEYFTDEGNFFMEEYYDKWLESFNINALPNMNYLDENLKKSLDKNT